MARCESSWDANSTILTQSKVRTRCWASKRYAYPHPLEIPVGVTSTSANRTSPANNPDNQLSHPASHYGPIETGKRKPPAPSTHGHTQIRPLPSPHDQNRLGLLSPTERERPSSFHASVSSFRPRLQPRTSYLQGLTTIPNEINAAATAPPQPPYPKK
jgi:hypothetical protein